MRRANGRAGGKPRVLRDIVKASRRPHRFARCRFACPTGTTVSQGFRAAHGFENGRMASDAPHRRATCSLPKTLGNRLYESLSRTFGIKQHQQITGSVTAIDVNTGAISGKYETEYPMLGGVLATAGDLVFVGHPSGELVALDAETLTELWRFETGKGLNAPPMTFAVGGKQFVAILAGAWPKWFVGSTKGLEKMKPSSLLYVFSL